MESPSIRGGILDDASGISEFVRGLSEEFIVGEFSAAARARFLEDHSMAKVRGRLAGDFRFYVAEHHAGIAGIAAIRSNTHLYYLFVGKPHQRTGLARRLLAQVIADALAKGNPGRLTVNASNHAVPAYEKLGFRRTEPTKNSDGVLYNPMVLEVTGGRLNAINVSDGGVPKLPRDSSMVRRNGLEGDRQRDLENHGGADRAVSVYSMELIDALRAEGHPIAPGTIGENLTLAGLPWKQMRPGVQFEVGDVVLEIVSYAAPCQIIAASFSDGRVVRVSEKVNPGWSRLYARVLEEGTLRVGDRVRMLQPSTEVNNGS